MKKIIFVLILFISSNVFAKTLYECPFLTDVVEHDGFGVLVLETEGVMPIQEVTETAARYCNEAIRTICTISCEMVDSMPSKEQLEQKYDKTYDFEATRK